MANTDPVVLPGHTILTEPDGTGDWSCSCGAAGSGPGSRDDHEQENRPVIPDLYDVEAALLEVARARRRRDEPTIAITQLAERLSANLVRHFGPEATETAGLALVVTAASIGVLVREGIPAEAITNLLAFAGQRIVVDSRAADAAPIRPSQEEPTDG